MTECNTDRLDFTRLGRRQIVADFLGGRLTTDAGALLLREVDRRIGLFDAINDCIPDPRDARFITHDQRTMLAQRIVSIALGYEDLNDQQTMRQDPALQLAAGGSPNEDAAMASPSTLCRLENRITRQTLVRLSSLFVKRFLDSHKTPPATIRRKLFRVAARVVTSVRRVVFHLSSSYPGRDIFRRLTKSLLSAPG